MKNIELLAPAGSFDALKAAVQNGADAVYLGGQEFSARAYASNFDRKTLKEAIEYAHIRDVKVYVALNTLIKENEIKRCIDYVKYLHNIDVDALIIQDIGIASIIKDNFPDLEIHASTQMVAHSIEDIKYLEKMGFSRAVLARELTVDEIKYISDNSFIELEVFVHGALCVCYSGQCLMSSMIGGRSGNRGRCAQPCRKEYDLVNLKTLKRIDHGRGKYLLSPKDLNTIENIDKIINSKAVSLKIEGRMKRPEYVAIVVSAYRQVIDNYIKDNKLYIKDEIKDDLYSIFNREFTKGYILKQTSKDIMNTKKPNNIGLYIGKVLDYDKKAKKVTIKLENTLRKGDGISLGGGNIGRIILGDKVVDKAYAGSIVKLDFITNVKKGEKVYKTLDSYLLDKARKSYENDIENKKIPIYIDININIDDYVKLTVVDNRKNKVTITSEKKAEKAINVPISNEKIKNQLSKLKNTPYYAQKIDINKDEDVAIPISVLNEMRRVAIKELNEKRANINKRKDININFNFDSEYKNYTKDTKLRVKVKTINQLKAIIDEDIDLIYFDNLKDIQKAIEICKAKDKKIAYSLPRIIRNDQYSTINKLLNIDISDIQVSNLGSINKFKQKFNIHADYFLNIFNSHCIKYLESENVKSICISPELNISEIKQSLNSSFNIDIEGLVYARIPLMISEYCPGRNLIDCDKCDKHSYGLKDQKGEVFPISEDEFKRGIIYNSKILCVVNDVDKIQNSGVNVFRIDFTNEDEKTAKDIVRMYTVLLKNNFKLTKECENIYNNLKQLQITNGHYFRGVE
ncbi:putative protease [Alkalithermobacter thermoalcaliphilus JW-YL-7 = DSM 7308]|uniref:Peptidase U32 n=1 Tax=Alkalithermobacter thermoalcaliphilus JW-YL-7 = DSM 7308 TaxID=1121328 RepID=A0A150FNZ2_CLOPD|nr:peptidase U32 [[Clostridium] paradoxum JW-YL-7 = DSM 7308]SHK55280.1 putative protease [[Clostridium] paradoxum JW-YL-7 = DSM 7308]